ncbi:MAG TPA: hypothetical protein VGN73_14860, partial [Gemmatimonadaceae bacterium]|nr:hypothetical protein [Gemmatimonadaceae bacterium]
MTCSECIEVLLEGDLTEDLDTHIRECERCTLAVQLLRDAQDSLSQDLRQQSVGLRPAQTLAEYAYRRVRRERLLWRIVLPVLLILIAATGMLITRTFGPELKRLTEPPPAVETSTFSLRC